MQPITDPRAVEFLERAPSALGPRPITDPHALGMLEYGIDFAQPVETVRAAVAKLPDNQREPALRTWADAFVATERKSGGVGMALDDTVRTLARGTFAGPFLDEISAGTAAAQHAVGLGGSPYDEALAYQRARDRAVDTDYPVLSTVGKLAGGIAGGVGAVRAGGGALAAAVGGPVAAVAPAATAAGRVAQGVGIGAGYGAVGGFGDAEGGVGNRVEGAARGSGLGAALGGAVGVGGEAVRQVSRARANMGEAGAYGTIAGDLPSGAGAFADQVATGASRGNVTTNRRTLDILGEEMQRAGGDVRAAQAAAVNRIAAEAGVTPQTAQAHIRRLTAVHEGSDLMLGEYPAVSGSDAAQRLRQPGNVDLDQLGRVETSTTQATLDYLANNGNAQSAQNVRNAVTQRQEQLGPSMSRTLGDIAPQIQTGPRTTRASTIEDVQQAIETARQLAHNDYQTAYRAQTNNAVLINWLPRMLQRYDQVAAGRSGEYATAMRQAADQFYLQLPTGQRLAMNTLQQLQDARGSLRGQMSGYARSGRDDLARVIRPLYDQVTRMMEHANPAWGIANRRWADMRLDVVGQELGDAFASRAGPRFREQMQEFTRLAPQAQDVVRIHFLQQMQDKLANLGDAHAISKLFANDHSRNMIRDLFGNEAVVTFARAVRDQKAAEITQRGLANSATHRRGVAQRQKDADTGLMSAVENASANGIRSWLMERATQLLTENRNRPMSDILTTPMSDTAQVARHLHNLRRQEDRLRRFAVPSQTTLPVAGAAAELGGGEVAPRNMMTGGAR